MNVKRLLLALFLAAALISVIIMGVWGTSVQVFVDQDPPIGDPNILDESLQSGYKFNITVNVANVADLYSYEFRLNWTGGILNATKIYQGPFLQSGGPTFFIGLINNTLNYVYVTCTLYAAPAGVWGNGTLVIIEFLVEDYGSTDLQLYDTILIDSLRQEIAHLPPVSGYFRNKYPGDVDGDYYVGSADFSMLAGAYGSSSGQPAYDREADFDLDGYVGSADFSTLAGNYGKTFP